jgi:hypothetical protein
MPNEKFRVFTEIPTNEKRIVNMINNEELTLEEACDLLNEQDQQIKEYKMVVASMMNPVKQVCKYYKETIKMIDSNREFMRPVGKCLKEQDIRHCDSCKYFIPNMLKL